MAKNSIYCASKFQKTTTTSCESKNHLNLNFMRYQKLNRFSDSEFQRLVGVPRPVFSEMIEVLKEVESLKEKCGRPHTLAIEDQLLLTPNYLQNTALNWSWLQITISLKVM